MKSQPGMLARACVHKDNYPTNCRGSGCDTSQAANRASVGPCGSGGKHRPATAWRRHRLHRGKIRGEGRSHLASKQALVHLICQFEGTRMGKNSLNTGCTFL